MYPKVGTVIGLLEKLAPPQLALEHDRIGLQVGSPETEVKKVLTALDVTEAVADEAVRAGAQLIVAHHPLIYHPLKEVRTDQAAGRILLKLLKNEIAVFAVHTNLDVAQNGVNDWLAQALGFEQAEIMETTYREPLYKLIVFVPQTHIEEVSAALFAAGAGHIGDYSHCSFRAEGIGTFLPGEGTNPYIGETGKVEQVRETRLETVVPASRKKAVLQAMFAAHPYEEPAFDLFKLELDEGRHVYGIGRICELGAPVSLFALAKRVKERLGLPAVRVVGDGSRLIRKAAVLGGSGSRYVRKAKLAGADVIITGDIDHHTAVDALAGDMCIIDAGHHMEDIVKTRLADYLRIAFAENGFIAEVHPSQIDTNPFIFL